MVRFWSKFGQNILIFALKLNNRTDEDILSALAGKPRQTEIKRLIRLGIDSEKKA